MASTGNYRATQDVNDREIQLISKMLEEDYKTMKKWGGTASLVTLSTMILVGSSITYLVLL